MDMQGTKHNLVGDHLKDYILSNIKFFLKNYINQSESITGDGSHDEYTLQ